MNETAVTEVPQYHIEKKKSTGTKELRAIERSVDSIDEALRSFTETIMRTEEKSGQISARLLEIVEAIKDGGCDQEYLKDELGDLVSHAFEEKFFTEKMGRGVGRMTDDTKLHHVKALTEAAAKIAATKHKMSAGDYTPTAVVIATLQWTINYLQKNLGEHLGPVAGQEIVQQMVREIALEFNKIGQA